MGIVSTYAIYGYRIAQVEALAQETKSNMEVVHEILQNIAVISTKMEAVEEDVGEIKQEVKELNEKI